MTRVHSMSELKGRIALITGAGQGIGRGVSLALAKAGAAVAVTGRTVSKLEETCRAVEAAGGRAEALACDVNSAEDIAATVERTVARLGGVDILVNNAQECPLGPLLAVTDTAFERGFSSGPLATFRMMKACYPHLKARGGGTIFNFTSSVSRRWDMSNYGAYAAVKQAIRSLTRAAAAEWGIDGIRVLTIAPHALSPGLKGWIDGNPAEAAEFFKTIPLRRVGDCETDIGRAIVALCGADFGYLTGATLSLDGGQANFD